MSFDWSEFLRVAKELRSQDSHRIDREAELRSSISRAYYAAFKSAFNFLRDVDCDRLLSESPRIHGYVQDTFEQSHDMDRRSVGIRLKRLHEWRKKADYNDQMTGLQSTTDSSILLAEKALTTLTHLHRR